MSKHLKHNTLGLDANGHKPGCHKFGQKHSSQTRDHSNCDCKRISKSKSPKRRRGFYTRRATASHIKKKAYELYKPYRPCRRTCCANHNPEFHAERMQEEHLKRLHASATKLMIMSVIPERPASADSAERARRVYMKEIDYSASLMHQEVMRRRSTLEK
jgi:hypothetical protein